MHVHAYIIETNVRALMNYLVKKSKKKFRVTRLKLRLPLINITFHYLSLKLNYQYLPFLSSIRKSRDTHKDALPFQTRPPSLRPSKI